MSLNLALYTGSAVTVGATEISATVGTTSIQAKTDVAVVSFVVDVSSLVAGDEYEFALYEKAIAGGTQRRVVLANLIGAQADLLFITGPFLVGVGWDFGLKKIAGTDHALTWSVRSVS